MPKYVFAVFCLCFFAAVTSLGSFSNTASAAEYESIHIDFCYNGKTVKYTSTKFENVKTFKYKFAGQQFGRWRSHNARAQLLDKVKNMGFLPLDALGFVLIGADEIVKACEKEINVEQKDASYVFNPNAKPYFTFTPETIGYKLDLNEVVNDIIGEMSKSNSFTIKLKPKKLEPNVFLNDLLSYNTLLGSFSTNFDASNANRKHNIELAMSKFNGLKMEQGKEYSFNIITGRRTEANGYKAANIIVDKKYVEGFGGGVCQASTTLYNALLLSEMGFSELNSHSLVSNYVQMGFDAMVNFGSSDLKWYTNSTKPRFMRTYVNGGTVGVEIYGARTGEKREFRRVTEILKKTEPKEDETIMDVDGEYLHKVIYTDEIAYISYPKTGYKVRAVLEILENGVIVERRFLRIVEYMPARGVKVVGVKTRPAVANEDVELNESGVLTEAETNTVIAKNSRSEILTEATTNTVIAKNSRSEILAEAENKQNSSGANTNSETEPQQNNSKLNSEVRDINSSEEPKAGESTYLSPQTVDFWQSL